MRTTSRKDILIILGITAFLFTGFICSARGTQEEDESEGVELNVKNYHLADKAQETGYDSSNFAVNEDRTVTDTATGLMWAQDDSAKAMNQKTALAYAENSTYAGYDDWRLPDVRELESIADYSGAFPTLDTSKFNISEVTDKEGNKDYPSFWIRPSNPHRGPQDEDGHLYVWHMNEGAVSLDGEHYQNYVRLVRGGNAAKTPDKNPAALHQDRGVSIEDGETGMSDRREGGPEGSQSKGAENTDRRQGPPQGRPDFAAAAEKLRITEKALIEALGEPGQGLPDFAAAAEKLDISEAELLKALGVPENGMPPGPRQ